MEEELEKQGGSWVLHDILFSFFDHHACRNPSCDSFSWFKCKDCKVAHYCDVKCQEEDWAHHEDICQQMKEQRKQMYLVPKLVQAEYERMYGAENMISFKKFVKEIAYGTYSMLYGAIKNPNFGTYLEIMLRKNKIPPELAATKTTLQKSKSRMLSLLESSRKHENCSFKESFNQVRKIVPKNSYLYNLLYLSKMKKKKTQELKFNIFCYY